MVHVNTSPVNFLCLPFFSMHYKMFIFIELSFVVYMLLRCNISNFSNDSFPLICKSLTIKSG